MPEVILEKTKDGSDTLFIPDLNEHYHSVNGAITESNHVFIQAGLKSILPHVQKLHVLEIGFGTGLNAWLTFVEAQKSKKTVYYTGIEVYPLSFEIIRQLDFSLSSKDENHFHQFHHCEWNVLNQLSKTFYLQKQQTDFTIVNLSNEKFDLIYFDAFAPDIQPEMWTSDNFFKLYTCLKPAGILTTYSAKGQVRRNMQQAGFTVERLPGPPGKREMLRAIKL